MGGGNDAVERRKQLIPTGNVVGKDEEDEEALSFSDLPTSANEEENEYLLSTKACSVESQEEFNFCSSLCGSGTDPLSKESEMCIADEVFFQGQILPLRHSISSDSGLITKSQNSKSESMNRCHSVGYISLSSRSSSINSHHSSCSSGTTSSSTATTTVTGSGSIKYKRRPKTRNQFQFSHPSPKPQIRSSNKTIRNGIKGNKSSQKSTLWNIFRVGLVTTPEIAVQDLKCRNHGKKNTTSFGSRNSTNSSTSNGSAAGRIKADQEKDKITKKKQKFFDRNGGVFFGGCKCSSNAVAGPIHPKGAENGKRRSGSSVNVAHAKEELEMKKKLTTSTKQHDDDQQQAAAGKQALSRHRTFEWLKQLSLEGDAAAVIDEA